MAGAGGAGVRVCGGFFYEFLWAGGAAKGDSGKKERERKRWPWRGKRRRVGGLGWGGGLSRFTPAFLAGFARGGVAAGARGGGGGRGGGLRLGASRSPYLRNQSKPVRERVVFSAVWWDFESSEHVGTWEGSRDENSHI